MESCTCRPVSALGEGLTLTDARDCPVHAGLTGLSYKNAEGEWIQLGPLTGENLAYAKACEDCAALPEKTLEEYEFHPKAIGWLEDAAAAMRALSENAAERTA